MIVFDQHQESQQRVKNVKICVEKNERRSGGRCLSMVGNVLTLVDLAVKVNFRLEHNPPPAYNDRKQAIVGVI